MQCFVCGFNASASRSPIGIVSYTFTAGDGSAATTQASPLRSYTFAKMGTYLVTLVVTDKTGNKSTVTASATLTAPPPTANLTASCVGMTCTLDASRSQAPAGMQAYTFVTGDGTMAKTQTGATHAVTYRRAGTYSLMLVVKDVLGRTATATATLVVK